jgi:hypothetical protein
MTRVRSSRRIAPLLWLLLAAFTLRVAGQLLVACFGVEWLPPMDAWMSGLLSYPALLAAQVVIIAVYAKICIDFTRGTGWFVRARPVFAHGLLAFGWLYSAAMLLRFAISFAPFASWLGGRIPIGFHLVLAAFVIVFASWHRGQEYRRG